MGGPGEPERAEVVVVLFVNGVGRVDISERSALVAVLRPDREEVGCDE